MILIVRPVRRTLLGIIVQSYLEKVIQSSFSTPGALRSSGLVSSNVATCGMPVSGNTIFCWGQRAPYLWALILPWYGGAGWAARKRPLQTLTLSPTISWEAERWTHGGVAYGIPRNFVNKPLVAPATVAASSWTVGSKKGLGFACTTDRVTKRRGSCFSIVMGCRTYVKCYTTSIYLRTLVPLISQVPRNMYLDARRWNFLDQVLINTDDNDYSPRSDV